MKKILAWCMLLTIFLIMVNGCVRVKKPRTNVDIPPTNQDSSRLQRGQVNPKKTEGGRYPAVKPDLKRPLNDTDTPVYVPKGPDRGKMRPANDSYKLKERKPKDTGSGGSSQAPLYFRDSENLDGATVSTHTLNPEPSIAENGNTILATGNFWITLSKDGGGTFTTINPTTVFPEDYGGFCCDQVLQYVPRYDMFVWLLQYGASGGVNAIRIAVASTEEVRTSNATAWTYWDFTNTTFAASGNLDYNDMSFGNTFLYWSSSVGGGANRYVVRVPLEQMRARGTVNFEFTGSTSAYWSHVTQNGSNGVYWAGHVNNSTLKVYSMMDADGFYSWRDVAINSWPNNTISSTAANGTDWLLDASWKTYIRAAAIKGNSILFGWNASSGGGFPNAHVQIAEINKNSFTLANQMQIWNSGFAFAYPYFETNSQGELGMIVAFGGGSFNASSGVGVWGDFVVYYPRLSDMSQSNYGHYHTVRRSGDKGTEWVASGYTHLSNGTVLPYYIRFSR
jgi:hypothetical protein